MIEQNKIMNKTKQSKINKMIIFNIANSYNDSAIY